VVVAAVLEVVDEEEEEEEAVVVVAVEEDDGETDAEADEDEDDVRMRMRTQMRQVRTMTMTMGPMKSAPSHAGVPSRSFDSVRSYRGRGAANGSVPQTARFCQTSHRHYDNNTHKKRSTGSVGTQ
jgi:hypothetical protein